MDTKDTSESNTQIPPACDESPQPDPVPGSSQTATTRIGPRSIIRRLAGRSWEILLLWLVVATPLAYLIYMFVEPTYEAFSVLQIEPTKESLFSTGGQNPTDRESIDYLQTQVQLITTDKVLDQALSADPRIANLPGIKSSKDSKADLRKAMEVGIVDKRTYLIRVALTSRDPEEAAALVNAVVDAYLDQHNEYHRSANKALHKSLSDELEKLAKDIVIEEVRVEDPGREGACRALEDHCETGCREEGRSASPVARGCHGGAICRSG